MTVTSPRVFIADFDLVRYSGHYFNQVLGFREAARARGIETKIYISQRADPKITEELCAHAILPFIRWYDVSKDFFLEGFACAQFTLSPLWKDLDAADVSERDILVITSSRPQVIFGVGQWLRAQPVSVRPAVVFRFLGPEFFDFDAKTFTKIAWAYHFASRSLPTVAGGERVFFTLNNEKALAHLERLSLRRAFYLPVPKHYGPIVVSPHARSAQLLTIYIHVNRPGQMPDRVIELVTTILQRHKDVNFLVRFCRYVHVGDMPKKEIVKELVGQGIELLPAEQNHIEYLAEIDRADMVLLPYDPVEYRGIVSGIFCEAVAMGKVAIVPAGTWIADHVAEGRATGVLFGENTVGDMVDAIERAIQGRKRLQAEAYRNAPSFREENSCAKNLDGMLELARQPRDMRLAHVPLTDATKAFGSQLYFGEGWSESEEDFGVWSDGARAEMNFSIRSDARALFFSVQVRPFLTAAHSRLDVSLTANAVPVAEWSFDATRRSDRDWTWHHIPISDDLVASGDIQIALNFRSPVSPKELGLSIDHRRLGVALRRFSLGPEIPDVRSESVPKRSRFGYWLSWLKSKWG
ncbi:MAG: hypothetical protein Q7V17_09845 [Afipia sp.]|nr:hypothetical protein [Afipia sp.]